MGCKKRVSGRIEEANRRSASILERRTKKRCIAGEIRVLRGAKWNDSSAQNCFAGQVRGKGRKRRWRWFYGESLRKPEMRQTATLFAGRANFCVRRSRGGRGRRREAVPAAGALLALRRVLANTGDGAIAGRSAGGSAGAAAAVRRDDQDGIRAGVVKWVDRT